jgi:hypothetical protein
MTHIELPENIVKLVLKLGEGEWCTTERLDVEDHVNIYRQILLQTKKSFNQDGPLPLEFIKSTKTGATIALIGTSPKSPDLAAIITSIWNVLYHQCLEQECEDTKT